MTHDEISGLLGAYALDAVDPGERRLVEDHLADCPRCRAEVEQHRETASLLAHTGGTAPEGVWQRISDTLDEPPPGLRLAPVAAGEDGSGQRSRSRLALAGLAAAAAVLVAVLGLQIGSQDQRIDELQTALEDPVSVAFHDAVEDPRSEVFELESTDESITVRAVITDDGVGYLSAGALPRLPADRTFQLWGAAGDEMISLGVIGAEPDVVRFRADAHSSFAVTEEVAPGVVVPTEAPVVAGSVS